MRLSTTTAKWIALALLGLAIAAGVAVAASNLVSRQIGIASESVSAGDALAPAVESATRQEGDGDGSRNPAAADDGGGRSEDDGGSPEVSEDELDDRIDAEEDARDEAEDAAEDRQDELEDLADDSSGKGSDD